MTKQEERFTVDLIGELLRVLPLREAHIAVMAYLCSNASVLLRTSLSMDVNEALKYFDDFTEDLKKTFIRHYQKVEIQHQQREAEGAVKH